MKRKLPTRLETGVDPEIIEGAKRALALDRVRAVGRCVVCGGEAAIEAAEQLCWVCRRLKISAWREVEQQSQQSQQE